MKFSLLPGTVPIQEINFFPEQTIDIQILRIDEIHPIVSGNKWFKLKEWIARAKNKRGILSFGGPYSNHLVATAFAAKELGIPSRGIIRGEKPAIISPSLSDAQHYGMELFFVTREIYRNPSIILEDQNYLPKDWIAVPEGGRGPEGRKGAESILSLVANLNTYTHIACAVGTGTMLAGICNAALPHQEILGISSLKGDDKLTSEVRNWIDNNQTKFSISFDYHFGGYAKHPPELIGFMNELFRLTEIPTDIVYTSKMIYGVLDLVKKGYFPTGSKLLLIHSGGLQGNRSLQAGTLIF